MALLILVLMILVGVGLFIIGCLEHDKNKGKISKWLYYNDDTLTTVGLAIAIIFSAIVLVSIIYMVADKTQAETYKSKCIEDRKAILYQIETDTNTTGKLSKRTVSKINKYNKQLIENKNLSHNFWVGVFYPNCWDEFETIDYNTLQEKRGD